MSKRRSKRRDRFAAGNRPAGGDDGPSPPGGLAGPPPPSRYLSQMPGTFIRRIVDFAGLHRDCSRAACLRAGRCATAAMPCHDENFELLKTYVYRPLIALLRAERASPGNRAAGLTPAMRQWLDDASMSPEGKYLPFSASPAASEGRDPDDGASSANPAGPPTARQTPV